ncbi:MAG: trypsin-like serine protease [Rhodospirillaceae bacterium]|jgi:uncharacterized protein|nr:trypsin-like serine protease [Rhodospirillaceae bacterium]MBT4751418.1 trypsin-like serine protease [Rhodospirillaceae bacterium]
MPQRLFFLPLFALVVLFAVPVGDAVGADLQKGIQAHKFEDYATALREFRPLAEQGDPEAQTRLGDMYRYGFGVPLNLESAKRWYKLAVQHLRPLAEQGDADAQRHLGSMYFAGKGVPRNLEFAMKWYRISAEQGNAVAQYELGYAYSHQLGWQTKQAGYAYSNGELFPQDEKIAVRWYKLSAKQGYAHAQFTMGQRYRLGEGVRKNIKNAVNLYRLSAEQGHSGAQHMLGWMYKTGQGVTRDYVLSYSWYTISSNLSAKLNLGKLDKLMSSVQIAKALQLARRFVPKTTSPTSPRNSSRKSGSTGSGFFVSKLGHVITNQHVVNNCKSVTVGGNANKQVTATIVETDQRNDLALLKISNMKTASVETKTLVAKLGLTVTPLASQGLLRPDSVELGEDVVVAGFPFADIVSNTVKVTRGIVSAKRGMGDDSGQFQMDAAVQKGSSGGPIYDENGNIIGVVVAQLDKLKVARNYGSSLENVNFGIKASTVRKFLNSSGLFTKWSKRSKRMSTKGIAKIAENQTVMVVCHQ